MGTRGTGLLLVPTKNSRLAFYAHRLEFLIYTLVKLGSRLTSKRKLKHYVQMNKVNRPGPDSGPAFLETSRESGHAMNSKYLPFLY